MSKIKRRRLEPREHKVVRFSSTAWVIDEVTIWSYDTAKTREFYVETKNKRGDHALVVFMVRR